MIHLVGANIKGLIFDLDGTLADTMPLHYQASQDICNPLGFDFPLDYFYSEAGRPTVDVFIDLMKILDNGLDGKKLALEKEERFRELIPTVKPIKQVMEVAEHFYGKLPLSIGTGGQRHIIMETLNTMGVTDMFDAIVSADDVNQHKPYPDTFLRCAEITKVPPTQCLVFEDGLPGIEAAKKAQMNFIDIREHL